MAFDRLLRVLSGAEPDEIDTLTEGTRGTDAATGVVYRCRGCGTGYETPKASCLRCGAVEFSDPGGE